MAQGRTGVNTATRSHVLLDAGEIFTGVDLTQLATDTDPAAAVTAALAAGTSLGATRGGAVLNFNRAMREIEADGQLGPVVGMTRRERVVPELTVTFIEFSHLLLLQFITGSAATVVGSTNSTWQQINMDAVQEADYLSNVCLVTTMGDEPVPAFVVLENVMAFATSLTTEDRNEGTLEVTFRAHFAANGSYVEPAYLIVPTGT